MGLLGDALHWLTAFAVATLEATGYVGLVLLMAAESMVLPVPSEAVMPFAGYLVSTGAFNWTGAILASSLGSLLGSWLSYLMGRHGLLPLVERYGKYVLVQPHHVAKAQDFFERRGTMAVFLCRFIPGVRHVSSIPAGAARMSLVPFLVASTVGATIWNVFLLWVGWRVGRDEAAIAAIKGNLDLAGLALLALLAIYVAYEMWKAKKAKAEGKAESAAPPPPPT